MTWLLTRIVVYRHVLGICCYTPRSIVFSSGDRDFLSRSNRSPLCETHVIRSRCHCIGLSAEDVFRASVMNALNQLQTSNDMQSSEATGRHNRRFLPSIGKYTSNTIGNSRERQLSLCREGIWDNPNHF